MDYKPAPFHEDLSEAPEGTRAFWIDTEDKTRLRVAHFPAQGSAQDIASGTLLLFPGRTEYVEKYGRCADEFTAAGLNVLTIDWRGQGLSDRLLRDPLIGHIDHFEDFQLDVKAMVAFAIELELPKPWYMLAHSMGGAIGLRAMTEGLDVAACAFSAPMWGIQLTSILRSAARALSWGGRNMGFGHTLAPGTKPAALVAQAPFKKNPLTTDRDQWDYMKRQMLAMPDAQLGGPSLTWLNEALQECRILLQSPSPDLPCITYLGLNDRIVDHTPIRERMDAWPRGKLVEVPGAEHEIMMEAPQFRDMMLQDLKDFFLQASSPQLRQSGAS